jgi:type II secretory pathway component PulM
MKAYWLAFKKKYWDVRSQQERTVLKVLAGVAAPFLLYFVLWQPAHTSVNKLRVSVTLLATEAERMKVQADEVERLRHRPKPALMGAAALKTAVEESALRNNLGEAISAMTLQEPNAVRITFVSVSFEHWLSWVRSLQQEQQIRAESVSVAVLSQPGMVKISATLVNGGRQ